MQLPEDFIKQTEPLFGDSIWQTFTSALDCQAPVSIRLNPAKARGMVPLSGLQDGIVPWCSDGYYLNERPNFTFDPLLHAGLYYVQEASSMFLDRVLRQYLPEGQVRMLDLCAAPGGKSTVARALLPAGSLLVSNEPVRTRAQILAENMMKQGCPDVIVTNNYARDIARSGLKFDIILADVPCSGEGMFRKDPGAVGEWSRQNVEKCWRLQREIITDVWPCLREGGILVYSTCTFNTLEDEENVRYIIETLGAEALSVSLDEESVIREEGTGITGSLLSGFTEPVYRFIPGLTRGEGLFVCVLRKHGERTEKTTLKKYKKQRNKCRNKQNGTVEKDVLKWISSPDDFTPITSDTAILLITKAWQADFDIARKSLNILSAGITAGEMKGNNIIPAQGLALSTALLPDAFPSVALDYDAAISYLRREPVPLPAETPRGTVLVTYRNHALGFMKNIGTRANNLYPVEWKIRSGHTPEGIKEILGDRTNN